MSNLHPLAGKPAPRDILPNIPRLVSAYYSSRPDVNIPGQEVSFGTSGHRGNSMKLSFNEDHILAIVQAVCDHRKANDITGPLFLGMDTHALSEPAHITTIEVLAANGVTTMVHQGFKYTPTPVISHAILTHNRTGTGGLADGLVITPSHNPPDNGGIKYNPPDGGPADTTITGAIAKGANTYLKHGLTGVKRMPYERALKAPNVVMHDFVTPYVEDLKNVVNLEAIAGAKLRLGADGLGGSGAAYWSVIADTYKLNIETFNTIPDFTFGFMTVDWDGKIRMDCSSPYAMAGLIALKDRFDVAFANDPDFDRHGIVTPSSGLMNPNHYLAVAIDYLYRNRPGWRPDTAVGKTLVSSSMIDRVAAGLGRRLCEVPVGFKWFVKGLVDGSFGFGGEESAGASFLRRDGSVWTTDKDGIILALLAAEITAVTGRDPGLHYADLTQKYGAPAYERVDAPANAAEKAALLKLTPAAVKAKTLAGEPITGVFTTAPGNGAAIGGLKVTSANGWFASRPSGTEDVCKLYAESFKGIDHLHQIQQDARTICADACRAE